MGFGESIGNCFSNYATFSGRAPRSEYWWFTLFAVLLNIVATVLDMVVIDSPQGFGVFSIVLVLAMFLPSLSVGVRRLHDVERSGHWYWIVFVPLIGSIVLFVFFLSGGTRGDNKYGADPLQARSPG